MHQRCAAQTVNDFKQHNKYIQLAMVQQGCQQQNSKSKNTFICDKKYQVINCNESQKFGKESRNIQDFISHILKEKSNFTSRIYLIITTGNH